MNDIEFEMMGRRASATVRDEADRIADSEHALAALLRERPATGTVPPADRLVDLSSPSPERRSWLPILVAAATIAAVGGLVLIANRGDDDITPSTEPARPVVRETTPVVVDTPTEVTVDEVDDVDPAEPDPGTPNTAPIDGDAIIAVPDRTGPTLERTVALSTTISADEAQLGWEVCQECEALRPWAPVITPDGAVYVADIVNNRWVWQQPSGSPITTPFAPGEVVVAAPVAGPDGLIYAAVAINLVDRSELRVLGFDPTTMTSIPIEYLLSDTGHDRLEIVNSVLMFGDQTVIEFPSSLGDPTIDIDGQTVTVALSGVRRRFALPDGWALDRGDAAPVGDGSVVLRAFAPGSDDPTTVLVRLWLDGTTATGVVSGRNATTNAAVQLGSVGLVQLERTGDAVEVTRYTLPEFVGADPLVGWTVPEFGAPSLDDLPRFLPQQPVPGVITAVRAEYADAQAARTSYEQTWVRSDANGTVNAVVQLTTRLDPSPVQPSDGDVGADIDGWPTAYFTRTIDGVVSAQLHTATRSMNAWAFGLERSDVTDLVVSLTVDTDSVGWTSPALDESAGWVAVNEGWSMGAASRTFTQQIAGDTYMEMWMVSGVPSTISTPGFIDSETTLIDIDGHPALAFDLGPDRSAVTWSPQDSVVILLGSRGPLDLLAETARSIIEVDQSTWEAASTVDTSSGDGCTSMFC